MIEPLSLVFIPAHSKVRSLNVSWRFVPFPASLSISCASVSPSPFMASGADKFGFTMLSSWCREIKEFRSGGLVWVWNNFFCV